MMKTNKRKSYRIEEQLGDAVAVQMVRETYNLNSDAAVFRQALRDEVLLLTLATNPEKMTATAAISRAKSGGVSAVDRVLLAANGNAPDTLQRTNDLMADCDDSLIAMLSDLHGMATNLNQISHHINALHDDLDEDTLVAALALVEGLRDRFVVPIKGDITHVKEVLNDGNPTI
ncbi:plasmid mobilization relaxosome protein MobC [Lactiplantibacillus nangangensis]|uniref:Plasmid mobilization relaxosome protein MobC n=1 Tax=Lactiplantibacillus nangangensis TaxID=2559917 RepID=A0ABW1SL98_9LACO|nr:plasmid mobilization relaxosome protein MobC [Lactiplantibacillus nangangensis]